MAPFPFLQRVNPNLPTKSMSRIPKPFFLLRQLIRRNLHHRTRIHLPRIKIIIRHRKNHHRPRHQTAEIHVRRVRIDHLRKEAENKHDDAVADAEAIQKNAPDSGHVEGTPDEFVGVPGCVGHLGGVPDGAAEAVPEEEGFGEDVGGVEGADADGEDVVEGGGGADVYEADGAGDAGHD